MKQVERAETTVEHSAGVVLTNARFKCTHCGQWKPGSHFGLRKMPDGKVRNQAQCQGCRTRFAKASGG